MAIGNVFYRRNGEVIEVTIRAHDGTRIESRKCNIADEKEATRLLKWLKEKYGFAPLFDTTEVKEALKPDLLDDEGDYLKF